VAEGCLPAASFLPATSATLTSRAMVAATLTSTATVATLTSRATAATLTMAAMVAAMTRAAMAAATLGRPARATSRPVRGAGWGPVPGPAALRLRWASVHQIHQIAAKYSTCKNTKRCTKYTKHPGERANADPGRGGSAGKPWAADDAWHHGSRAPGRAPFAPTRPPALRDHQGAAIPASLHHCITASLHHSDFQERLLASGQLQYHHIHAPGSPYSKARTRQEHCTVTH
jgi:hypothetical protein